MLTKLMPREPVRGWVSTRGPAARTRTASLSRPARQPSLTVVVLALLLAWTLLLLTPMAAFAAELRQGDAVVVTADEIVNDDLYAFGQSIIIRGTVTGDVIAAGQMVTIDGDVQGDVMAAANQVTINGPVSGAVRAAGQYVTLNAMVGQDALVGAATLTTSERAEIGRDLLVGAGTATLAGPVGRSIRAGSESLTIAAPVGGDVMAQVGSLRLASGADVQGSLTYTSAENAVMEPGAGVQGATTRLAQPAAPPEPGPVAQLGGALLGWLQTLVGMSVFGLLLILLMPRYTVRSTATLATRPWPSLGIGFAALVGIPVVAVLLFVVGLLVGGWWLGLLLLGLLFALIPVSYVVVGLVAGQLVLQRTGLLRRFDRPQTAAAWSLLAGLALLGLVGEIPILGWIVLLSVVLFGLGAAILTLVQVGRGEPEERAAPLPLHDYGEPLPAR